MSYIMAIAFINYLFFPLAGLNGSKASAAADISSSRLVDLLNYSRTESGLQGLSVDERLVNAAIAKANDMFSKQYWAHFGPHQESPWMFIKGAGYGYVYAGENLAKGFNDSDSVHSAWMNSPSHRANVLKKQYKNIGIAAVTGILQGSPTTLVVEMFGSTTEAVPGSSDDKPKILEPIDGGTVVTKDFDIKGDVQSSKTINVYDGNNMIGNISPEGGAFSYQAQDQKDGEHQYLIKASDQAINNVSNTVNITVNTSDVIGKTKYLAVTHITPTRLKINGVFASDVDKVNVQGIDRVADIPRVGNTNIFELPSIDFSKSPELTITVTDKQGNKDSFNINLSKGFLPIAPVSIGSVVGAQTLDVFKDLSDKQKVNFLFISFVLVIFGIDAYFVFKNKIKRNTAKSALHILPVLMVLLITLTSTGIGGQI